MGYQYFPFSQSQGYDPQTCADACDAQTLYDSQHPAADGSFLSCVRLPGHRILLLIIPRYSLMPMSFPRTPSHKVFTAPCTTRHGIPHTVQTTASTADLIVTPCPNPTATPRRKSQYDPRWHLFAPHSSTLDLSSCLDQLHLNGAPPVFLPKEKYSNWVGYASDWGLR